MRQLTKLNSSTPMLLMVAVLCSTQRRAQQGDGLFMNGSLDRCNSSNWWTSTWWCCWPTCYLWRD
uniref:Candidate secreted effector n=1 Tax=Meloidogyne incognita TaxID=6306 RepID=A0A914L9E0_MELIC